MYNVRNINNPNWKKYPYAVIRDCSNEPDERIRGYWYYGSYKKLEDAYNAARNLGNGLVVETASIEDPNELTGPEQRACLMMAANLTINSILDQAFHRENHIRFGQAVFNAAFEIVPTAADKLRSTKHDCFYNDSKVEDFLEQLRMELMKMNFKKS